MTALRQDIRFARTKDGLRIADAVSDHGYPLVRGATWFSNVAVDAQTSIMGPLFGEISARYCLYCYYAGGYLGTNYR